MRKLKEVFRLHFAENQSLSRIALSCGCGRTTIREYLDRARLAGLESWEAIESLGEDELEERLFRSSRRTLGMRELSSSKPLPDWSVVHREMARSGVTLGLLWQEYFSEHPDGFHYSRFAELYALWRKKLSVVMRQNHRAGEKGFIDYCDGLWLTDPRTGERKRTQLFVACLGASSYTFAEATATQSLPEWLMSHVRFYEFLGGVPELTIPDNLRSAVKKACYYDPEINPSYRDLARHYGTIVLPARVRKPRDKAKVEAAVLVAQRWILAVLRNRIFHSISEMNAEIRKLLIKLNARSMRHVRQSRLELFESIDRPTLKPLPITRYEFAEWTRPRLNIDYHVEFDRHFYSASYTLIQRKLDLRATAETIEIFYQGKRVASHVRSFIPGKYTTDPTHRPERHRAHSEWSPDRMIQWAGDAGPKTVELVRQIFERKEHPEQAYRSVLGVIRLGKNYGKERLERAAEVALKLGSPSYRTIQSVLKNGRDAQAASEDSAGHEAQLKLARAPHPNVRGKGHYH